MDGEVSELKLQVQAYRSRNSMLQQRLISTLDTLDHTIVEHTIELDEERQRRRELETKIRRYHDDVRLAQAEREDLRESVLQLIAKVETEHGDLKKWPKARLHLSSLADRAPELPANPHSHDTDELLSYAAAMISSLRQERDFERRAHRETKNALGRQIHSLEAQLARRETELETRSDRQSTDSSAERARGPRKSKTRPKPAETLSQHDIVAVLEQNAEKNKQLETEVKTLFRRLEEVRSASKKASPPSPMIRQGATIPNSSHAPPSPMGTVRPSSQEADVTVQLSDGAIESSDQRRQINILDHQIQTLAAEIEAFRNERILLSQAVNYKPLDHLPSRHHCHSGERFMMDDEHLEENLRNELNDVKTRAAERETELLKEIKQLREELEGNTIIPQQCTAMADSHRDRQATADLLETQDGEVSMELATPLFPTSLLPSLEPITDAPSGTPGEGSPNVIPIMIHGTASQTHSPTSDVLSNMERVQREIAEAQRRLEDNEQELRFIHDALQDINI